jgi:adenylylsulfate kinase-like enzyme
MSRVLWITGLSGAGKSTLAQAVVKHLRSTGDPAILLDGDELRGVFGSVVADQKNHGREARLDLAMQYARLCQVLAGQRFTVVMATISMFHEIHAWNRQNLPGYTEIYLKVPLEELSRRDSKGIYRRFAAGELTHVAGLDLAVDEPREPHLVIDFQREQDLEQSFRRVIQLLDIGGSR